MTAAPDRLALDHYPSLHQAELRQLLASPAWQEAIADGTVATVAQTKRQPGHTRDFIGTVFDQLVALNEDRVRALAAAGTRDPMVLRRALGRWPQELGQLRPKTSFLGLNLTADCNFSPRCVYCNQPHVEATVGLDGWQQIIDEVTLREHRDAWRLDVTARGDVELELWAAHRHGAALEAELGRPIRFGDPRHHRGGRAVPAS